MCLGGWLVLNPLIFRVAAEAGYPALRLQYPELSMVLSAIALALPMVAWMRFRGHDWRPTLEMAGSTFALAALLIVGYRAGALSWMDFVQIELAFCGPACVAMLIPMLVRLDMYAGHHGHAAHGAHPA
jgi:hypothetical protein